MINKIVQSMAEAMAGVRDGSVVLIGGFGSIGQPNALIEGLIEQGAKDLTLVANNSGVGYVGLAALRLHAPLQRRFLVGGILGHIEGAGDADIHRIESEAVLLQRRFVDGDALGNGVE